MGVRTGSVADRQGAGRDLVAAQDVFNRSMARLSRGERIIAAGEASGEGPDACSTGRPAVTTTRADDAGPKAVSGQMAAPESAQAGPPVTIACGSVICARITVQATGPAMAKICRRSRTAMVAQDDLIS